MAKSSKKSFYAVKRGHAPGVYQSWPDAEQQVRGFPGALHRGFKTMAEAEAWCDGGTGDQGATPPTKRAASSSTSNTTNSSSSSSSSSRGRPYSLQQAKQRASKPDKKRVRGTPFDPASIATKEGWMTVYADGACKGNGKTGAYAGIGVHWVQPSDAKDLAERLPGKQTNQCAELYAIVRLLQEDPDPSKPLMICTDSQYAIKCLCEWIQGWLKRNWRNKEGQPVQNKELIQLAYGLFQRRTGPVKFKWVPGHSGVEGNEIADRLAVEGSRKEWVKEEDWSAELKKLDETPVNQADEPRLPEADEDDDWLLTAEEEEALANGQDF